MAFQKHVHIRILYTVFYISKTGLITVWQHLIIDEFQILFTELLIPFRLLCFFKNVFDLIQRRIIIRQFPIPFYVCSKIHVRPVSVYHKLPVKPYSLPVISNSVVNLFISLWFIQQIFQTDQTGIFQKITDP